MVNNKINRDGDEKKIPHCRLVFIATLYMFSLNRELYGLRMALQKFSICMAVEEKTKIGANHYSMLC